MKAKKHVSLSQNENNIKAVMAFMIIFLAFGIFVLFYNYKDSIIADGLFQVFMMAVIACMALLTSLLYLVNKK